MGHKSIFGDVKKFFNHDVKNVVSSVSTAVVDTVNDPKFQKAVVSDLKVVGSAVESGANAYIQFEKDNLNLLKDAGDKALSFGGSIFKGLEQDMMIAGAVVGVVVIAYVYSKFK